MRGSSFNLFRNFGTEQVHRTPLTLRIDAVGKKKFRKANYVTYVTIIGVANANIHETFSVHGEKYMLVGCHLNKSHLVLGEQAERKVYKAYRATDFG